jgi:type IV pilus assembly protein PilB
MGLEPFLLTSTMQSILGQRLIRTTCPSCGEPYLPTDDELEDFGVSRDELSEDNKFLMGAGCDECSHSGYKGRLGIFEHLNFNEEICDLVLDRATTDLIHAKAVQNGMATMRQDGWRKICAGITSFSEVAKQTPRENQEQIRMEMQYAVNEEAEVSQAPAAHVEEEAYGQSGGLAAPWEKEMAAKLK